MPTDTGKTWIPHLRLSFGGVLVNDASGEIWSNTIRYVPASTTVPAPNTLQTVADAVATPLAAWFSRNDSLLGVDAVLRYVKATWILANGKQRDQDTAQHNWAGSAVTGTNSNYPIWEQSYCITFRTAVKRGRTHAGRIYPPLSGNQPEPHSPYCAAADATKMAHSFGLALTQIGTAVAGVIEAGGPTGGFAVVSPGDNAKGTLPMYQYISGVVVDRVADIMHSRTNRVPRAEGTLQVVPTNV